jgi:sec-independent protein translocase protein TatC
MDSDRDPSENLLPDEEEGYGGPIKSFLEHLEDLRWVLIRVAISIGIGMLVCLVASNRIVEILTWPLDRANVLLEKYFQTHVPEDGGLVYLQFGTNVWRYSLKGDEFSDVAGLSDFDASTNQVAFQLAPLTVGTNKIIGIAPIQVPETSALSPKGQLINLGPFEGFKVAFQVALYGGIALALPFIFLFIGHFVLPALKVTEKRLLYQAVILGGGLFIVGVLFCYFILLQVVVMAAVQFSNWLSFGADQWRASDYIGTVCKLLLAMGLGFELPVVVLTLVKLGLLDYEAMRKFRPFWVVINLVVSALIMPPDGITMFMMAIPMQLLFEISLLVAKVWYRRDQAEAAESQ